MTENSEDRTRKDWSGLLFLLKKKYMVKRVNLNLPWAQSFPGGTRHYLHFTTENRGTLKTPKYLESVKTLGCQAGLNDSYVVNRFLDGVNDSILRDKILAVTKNPSLSAVVKICNMSGFDMLLERNVQHIWERIFLHYLDYETFKNCTHVSQAWKDIFEKESFVAKVRSEFAAELWMDTDNLERKVWKCKRKIYAWTTTGKEVAYAEGTHDFEILPLH